MSDDKAGTDLSPEPETTVSGIAYNAKAGAILMLDDETPVYIEGMEEWPDQKLGKRMKLKGRLSRQRIYPDVKVEGGSISQGMAETPLVLKLTQPINEGD